MCNQSFIPLQQQETDHPTTQHLGIYRDATQDVGDCIKNLNKTLKQAHTSEY